jgi:hypothetical protein
VSTPTPPPDPNLISNPQVPPILLPPAIIYSERNQVPEADRARFDEHTKSYCKVMFFLLVFYALMVIYIIAFRFASSNLQFILPVCSGLTTFIFRKVFLTATEPFPLEPAMVISGFWVENIEDMFSVMVYPQVKDASSFIVIWVVPTAVNIANLAFLTDGWFRFRIHIKQALKTAFCCAGNPCKVHVEPVLVDDPNDRGQSNNRQGYRRRQIRFYVWKLISQAIAMLFFMLAATTLRFGANRDYFPMNESLLCSHEYRNAMIFSACNLVFIAMAAYAGIAYVRRTLPHQYVAMLQLHRTLFANHRHMGFVAGIAIHNGLLCLASLLHHNQIWWRFDALSTVGC